MTLSNGMVLTRAVLKGSDRQRWDCSGVVTDPTIPSILTINAVDTFLRLTQVKLTAE